MLRITLCALRERENRNEKERERECVPLGDAGTQIVVVIVRVCVWVRVCSGVCSGVCLWERERELSVDVHLFEALSFQLRSRRATHFIVKKWWEFKNSKFEASFHCRNQTSVSHSYLAIVTDKDWPKSLIQKFDGQGGQAMTFKKILLMKRRGCQDWHRLQLLPMVYP